jgi:hypothetical protein
VGWVCGVEIGAAVFWLAFVCLCLRISLGSDAGCWGVTNELHFLFCCNSAGRTP